MATECIIDGSHMRVSRLDYLIVFTALAEVPAFRARLDRDDWMRELYERAEGDYLRPMSDLSDDDVEELRWLADEAENALNGYDVDRVYWVEDSCLWAAG